MVQSLWTGMDEYYFINFTARPEFKCENISRKKRGNQDELKMGNKICT